MKDNYIHTIGPEKLSEIYIAYDELFSKLKTVPENLWEVESLYEDMVLNGNLIKMQNMIDIFEYMLEFDKAKLVEKWLNELMCTGTLLLAKQILNFKSV